MKKVKKRKIPSHVAFIMDGNGRWANRRGLTRYEGHKAGVDTLRKILTCCRKLGIRYMTIYAFSTENWKRPKDEVNKLMNLFKEQIEKNIEELDKNGVRVRIIGRLQELPETTRNSFQKAEERTKDNKELDLNIALNYGGRIEIIDSFRKIIKQIKDGSLKENDVDEDLVKENLYINIPEPDLLIRTSGEMRISNFLIWQTAYTEYYSTKVLWPDFDSYELLKAVYNYQKRKRKFGLVGKE